MRHLLANLCIKPNVYLFLISVDISAKADWELRLYSCDERMAMPDTNAFKVLRAQKPHNDEELELIQVN